MFARKGIAGASLDDVAQEAGVTKGSVYGNFANKDDLIAELIWERLEHQTEELADLVKPDGSLTEQMAIQGGEYFMRVVGSERDTYLLALEFNTHLARNPHLLKRYGARYRKHHAAMAALIQEGADYHGVELPLPAGELVNCLFALGGGLALTRIIHKDDIPDDLFSKMLTLIFGGMTTQQRGGKSAS